MNIGIVGLGLMGGSMAKSTKARTSHTVFGVDTNSETMTLARLCGAIDAPLSDENLAGCDLIFLAIRPRAAVDWVRHCAESIPKSAVVIDMCGVKRSVCGEIRPIARQHGFTFLGGHPMTGKERGGFVSSSGDLFEGASMIITPDESADIVMLETVKNFFLDVGFASLTISDPDEHDRIIAYTSQLAHIASSAYVRSPEALRRRGYSAGSFRDMTRVARLDADMWTELFLSNTDYLEQQLGIFIDSLQTFHAALKERDSEQITALLREGCEIKANIGEN